MSSFGNKGKRSKKVAEKKEATRRMREVYKIMHDLDKVAKDIYINKEEVNEENVLEIASKYTDRKLEGLEKHILLNKLDVLNGKEETGDKPN